jgi:hypothetical protein
MTPAERLAAVARSLMMREARCSSCDREAQPYKPDYADFRAALEPFVEIELLKVQLEEAQRSGVNSRITELRAKLGAAYLAASRVGLPVPRKVPKKQK